MALGRVGLEAVLLIAAFQRDQQQYEKALDSMQKKTDAAARKIQNSGKQMAGSFSEFNRASQAMNSGISISIDQMQNLGQIWDQMGRPKIDVAQFDQAVAGGKSLEEAMRQATGGIQQVAQASTAATGSTANFALGLVTLRYAIRLVEQAVRQLKEAYDSVYEVAALQDMKMAFVNLAATSGVASQQLIADMRAVAQGTLDTQTIILAANRALLAGGSAFAEDLPRLMEIAMAASKATGKSFEYTFDSLIKGIAKGTPKLIDNAEIYIKLGDVVEDYARENNIAVDAVSGETRMELVRAAVLEKGTRAVEAMGGAMGESTKSFRQLNTQWKDLTDGVKTQAIPAVEELNNRLISLVSSLKVLYALLVAGNQTLMVASSTMATVGQLPEVFRQSFAKAYDAVSGGVPKLDALTEAQRRAAGAATELADRESELNRVLLDQQKELSDLQSQYNKRFAQIQQQDYERFEDMQKQQRRQAEDDRIALNRKMEDIENQRARKLADLTRDHERKLADIKTDMAKKVQEFIDDANKKREELEIKHQQRLQDIQLKYQDTVEEAARSNDAVAVVRAMRQRQRDLRDADIARQREAEGLERDLSEKREKIVEDADTRRQDEIDRYNQALADQQEAERQQAEDLALSLRRQEEDRQLSWQRQEEDRQESYDRQMDALNRWHAEEKAAIDAHYMELITGAQEAVITAGEAIAAATTVAITAISTAALNAEQQWANRHAYLGGQTTPAPPSTIGLTPEEQWRKRHDWFRGEGGLDVVSRPTSFVMGERGPEAVLSVPLGGQVNVNHRFSPLNVGVSGLPGGMNMDSIQSLMWQTMTAMAQQLLQGS